MADVGAFLDIEFRQQIELAGGGINLRSDLGIRQLVGNLVGFAELALDLDEERNHRNLRAPPDPKNRNRFSGRMIRAMQQNRTALASALAGKVEGG
jgi:hypothetical protein